MSLSPEEAGEILGVPAVQLERWAYLGDGPKNIGTKWKPRFDEEGIEEWMKQLGGKCRSGMEEWKSTERA